MHAQQNRNAGFTMLELMIVIAIVGIVVAAGMPSLVSFVKSTRASTDANEFLQLLYLARSEAIRRGVTVYVCKSDGSLVCESTAPGYEDGVVIYADLDGDGTFKFGSDVPIRIVAPLSRGSTIVGTGNVANQIGYRPDGRSTTNGSFTITPDGAPEHARKVVVNLTGRPYVS